jgi:hypothetical protein
MAHKPVGIGSSFSVSSGAATTSQPFQVYSDTLRIVSTTPAFVKIDSEPTASPSNYYVSNTREYTLALSPTSARIAGITTGATTIIDFLEGTFSPFGVGDYVSLTSPNQSYYNFTHKRVLNVQTSAMGVDGYHSRRIIIENNSTGIVTAYTANDADLRTSAKISAYGLGAGAIYYHQVQISGDA